MVGLVRSAVALIVVAVCALALPAHSQSTVADEAPQTLERSPLMAAIIADLSLRSSRNPAEPVKSWLSEIEGFYRVPGAKPLWLSADGALAPGIEAVREIHRASEWGLDATQFDVPDLPDASASLAALAAAEVRLSLAAVKYVWHARGGRVDPSQLSLWLDQKPRLMYANAVLETFATATDAAAQLRAFHPKHRGFEQLRQAYLAARGLAGVREDEMRIAPEGPKLVRGNRHPHAVIVRQLLGQTAEIGNEDRVDSELLEAVHDFMAERGYRRIWSIDDTVRAELNRRGPALKGSKQDILNRYLVNLERWRWLPEDMGPLHVWNNLPEFTSRVMKNGKPIHEERIIIGKPETQTPVFSDAMSHVIFNPEWGMPESIKIRQLLGPLRGGDYDVLRRRGLKILGSNGKETPARNFNWRKTNIRDVAIVQGAGPGNPLGRLKFIFPNAHDVYMHDTPDKHLFDSRERSFSHGCMRLRNPARLAEVILGETMNWSPADVAAQLKNTKDTLKIDLPEQVPVHVTYFTLTADADGKIAAFKDVYGHDKRILDAMTGSRSIQQIAAADPALVQRRANQELIKNASGYSVKKKPVNKVVVATGPFLFGGPPQAPPAPAALKKAPQMPQGFFFFP